MKHSSFDITRNYQPYRLLLENYLDLKSINPVTEKGCLSTYDGFRINGCMAAVKMNDGRMLSYKTFLKEKLGDEYDSFVKMNVGEEHFKKYL